MPTRHQRQADDLAFLLEQGINLILPPRDHIEPGDLIVSDEKGVAMTKDEGREAVYGMPYEQWKAKYQNEATPEQIAAMKKAASGH